MTAVSLNSPEGLDYAAGHALLRGVGGVLLDETDKRSPMARKGQATSPCATGLAKSRPRAGTGGPRQPKQRLAHAGIAIGISAWEPEVADRFGREDSGLSHPNEVCADACGVYAAAMADGVRTGDREAMLHTARDYARTGAVAAVLALAEERRYRED